MTLGLGFFVLSEKLLSSRQRQGETWGGYKRIYKDSSNVLLTVCAPKEASMEDGYE